MYKMENFDKQIKDPNLKIINRKLYTESIFFFIIDTLLILQADPPLRIHYA